MIGRTIQHYEIVETLGRGGMGVVYKARDTHLDRFVAIKVLPPEKVADPERKRRFVQEAKAASALNHPNIVHIYDIAETDGIQFIAMEYVPGKTLDQMIGRKGLRLNETLKCAVQIADALAQAHAAGIIHRDLKPSNVMVTDNGLVKVLDFGLAKLTETATGEFAETATIEAKEAASTEEGTIVGTVAYMSPEQAEGKKVDARSDIFSFGSLLYEMITGRRAFQGQTKVATLSAILHQEPKAASQIVAETPHELEKIIARCLRKNADRRFQHMADLKVALEELKEESESGSAVAPVAARRRGWLWSLAVPGLIVVAGVAVWMLARSDRTPEAVLVPVPLTSYPGNEWSPSFSPDGNQVAFAWNGPRQDNYDIYIKLVGTGPPVRLTSDPADDISPAWSPDGRSIAFLRVLPNARNAVFLIPAIGGPERKVAEVNGGVNDAWPPYLSWFPDSKWLVAVDQSAGKPPALVLVSVESGEKKKLTAPPPSFFGDQDPAVSPDGRAVVFSRNSEGQISDLYILTLSEDLSPQGEPKRLAFDNAGRQPAWTKDGRAIVFTSGSDQNSSFLKIVLARRGWRNGKAERLAFAGQDVRQPAISRNGRLAYAHFPVNMNVWRLDLGGGSTGSVPGMRAEKPAVKLIASTWSDQNPTYSPDGKRIAFASSRSGSREIWVCNSDGSNAVQLTSFGGPYYTADPRWSPDGRWIFFWSEQEGHGGTYVISYEGGRPKRIRPEDALPMGLGSGWSRDGKWMYFNSNRSGEDQLWRMPWPSPGHGEDAVQVTRKGGGVNVGESSDGRSVFYLKDPDMDFASIWKVAVKGGEETQVLESVLNWNSAVVDQGIYFIPNSKPRSVRFLSFRTGKVVTIADIPQEPGWGFSVSPDGHWLLYTALESIGSDLMLVENFR